MLAKKSSSISEHINQFVDQYGGNPQMLDPDLGYREMFTKPLLEALNSKEDFKQWINENPAFKGKTRWASEKKGQALKKQRKSKYGGETRSRLRAKLGKKENFTTGPLPGV